MFEFPYINPYKKLEEVLNAVKSNEVPDKFTYRYLAKIGFTSSKDRDFIPAFRLLGLIDAQGRPTTKYTDLRDLQQFEVVLGKAIKETYIKLFETDPNPRNVSENVLIGYFGKLTGKSHLQSVVYAKTFLELSRLSNLKPTLNEEEVGAYEGVAATAKVQKTPSAIKAKVQNINLNINLPTTTDGKVYETLFKHLKELLTLE